MSMKIYKKIIFILLFCFIFTVSQAEENLKSDIESLNVNLTEEINKKINDIQIIHPNPCP